MQRWIVAGVVAMFLLFGGGGFAYWNYRQNLPSPIWVPIPMNHELPLEQREKFAKQLKEKIVTPGLLDKVSQDLDLATKWKLATAEAATAELRKRLFVRAGEMDTPGGKVPSMNIGVDGRGRTMPFPNKSRCGSWMTSGKSSESSLRRRSRVMIAGRE